MKRRILSVLVSIALVGVLAGSGAWAANPHFIHANATFNSTAGTLTCSWKEAGLGDNVTITYLYSADATAIYACINGGGKHANAANKETVSGPVSSTGDFSSGKNGQITGSLTVQPPGAGAFSCPPGQDLELGFVYYYNIQLADTTTPVDAGIAPSSLSACLLPSGSDAAAEVCP